MKPSTYFLTSPGGEKARARIAKIMLDEPDVLILDEPTNDLDIPTLEILEQSLSEFQGALVLVTHDRFMINRLGTNFLGLDGKGHAQIYADYEQWEREVLQKTRPATESKVAKTERKKSQLKRLSYMEQREYDGLEDCILKEESKVEKLQVLLSQPEVQSDPKRLQEVCAQLSETQHYVETLYSRWEELEQKKSRLESE